MCAAASLLEAVDIALQAGFNVRRQAASFATKLWIPDYFKVPVVHDAIV